VLCEIGCVRVARVCVCVYMVRVYGEAYYNICINICEVANNVINNNDYTDNDNNNNNLV
jgi:hypothetical protein